jgi:hypothetical protein
VRSPAPNGSQATPNWPEQPASRRSQRAPGKTDRHRLDRSGNRQINAAIHRMAVTRARSDARTQDYITRNRDAIRCLKRHLARRVWQLLRAPSSKRNDALSLRDFLT